MRPGTNHSQNNHSAQPCHNSMPKNSAPVAMDQHISTTSARLRVFSRFRYHRKYQPSMHTQRKGSSHFAPCPAQ